LAAGIRWPYIPFRASAAALAALFQKLKDDGLVGANFTYPCKEAAFALCDDSAPEAATLRAANCVRITGGRVTAFNTDVAGFYEALQDLAQDVRAKPVLILGIGAAARACGLALERAGADVTFAARDLTRPRAGVSPAAAVIHVSEAETFLRERPPALLVNATPVGLRPGDQRLFDYGAIPQTCFVYDLNYGRPTPLLAAAAARGLRYADGLGMLISQAARSFEIWTGRPAPTDVMRRAAEVELRKRHHAL